MSKTISSRLLSSSPTQLKCSIYFFIVVTTINFTFAISTSFADLVLTAPPRETAEDGKHVYAPLANYLSQFLGEPVVYEHPLNWKQYEKKMKNDEYDIIFDGPHFAAWRIDSLLAKPLIKLPGALRFVLVVNKSEGKYKVTSDLIGKTICTLPAPNLGALTLYTMYPYPARQPDYKLIKGGFREVSRALAANNCDAAILRASYYYKKVGQLFRDNTRVIKRSKGLTNQGITVSRRINANNRKKLIQTLIKGEGRQALKPILDRFYSKANTFIPASSHDYQDHNLLRDTVIYGW